MFCTLNIMHCALYIVHWSLKRDNKKENDEIKKFKTARKN